MKNSWANLFRADNLPILLKSEDAYATLYGSTGLPNFSVARMPALCLLQGLNDMSNQQALDIFGFDIRWRYALDAGDDDSKANFLSFADFDFKKDSRVAKSDPYQLLVGLFNEQCLVEDKPGSSIGKRSSKLIKVKNKTKGEQLQSPFDQDASYDHKENGYSTHVTETCSNKKVDRTCIIG